jgi:hypothetical protein
MKFILILDLAFLFYLIHTFRNSKPIILIFLFFLLTLQPFLNYYFFGQQISKHSSFNEPQYYNQVIIIYSLFLLILFSLLALSKFKFKYIRDMYPKLSINGFWFYSLSIILYTLINLSTQGSNLLESDGNYGREGFITSYFEYGVLLLIIIGHTTSSSKFRQFIYFLLTVFYIYKSILFGSRITVLSVLLLNLILFESKIKNVLFYSAIIVSYFVFNLIGLFRAFLFDFNFYDIFNLAFLINPNDIQSNHQSDVVHSSVRLIGMLENNIISLEDRIISFISNLAAIVIPFKYLPDIANLSMYRSYDFDVGGGGIFPIYFFVWFGYLGSFISAFLIFSYFSIVKKKLSVFNLLFVVFLITSPRWIMYSPINLFKMSFLFLLMIFVLRQLKVLKFN